MPECTQQTCVEAPKQNSGDDFGLQMFANASIFEDITSLDQDELSLICEGLDICAKLTPQEKMAINTAFHWLYKIVDSQCSDIKQNAENIAENNNAIAARLTIAAYNAGQAAQNTAITENITDIYNIENAMTLLTNRVTFLENNRMKPIGCPTA